MSSSPSSGGSTKGIYEFCGHKEGILEKRGSVFGNWQRRFVALRDYELSYYKKESDLDNPAKVLGCRDLRGCDVMDASELFPSKKGFAFVIVDFVNPANNLLFRALSIAERDDWMHAMLLVAGPSSATSGDEYLEQTLSAHATSEEMEDIPTRSSQSDSDMESIRAAASRVSISAPTSSQSSPARSPVSTPPHTDVATVVFDPSHMAKLNYKHVLYQILHDKGLCLVFRDFLHSHFNQENLVFWFEVEDFRRRDPTMLRTRARFVYDNYLRLKAEYEVNIDYNLRSEFRNVLKNPTASSADLCQAAVHHLMAMDSVPKFLMEYPNLAAAFDAETHRIVDKSLIPEPKPRLEKSYSLKLLDRWFEDLASRSTPATPPHSLPSSPLSTTPVTSAPGSPRIVGVHHVETNSPLTQSSVVS
eukprot:TRINITY_DN12612_c0_g1_i1.p1 TRINITY_DN12612_c0_g1~~TRINITY_DN12612_c0_g1_i1.p1  ORF type:complete len:417 (-),score=75.63 TRINITY_DN12612_c0_g1_i1:571-1821(-)